MLEEKKINGRKHVLLECAHSGEKFWKDKSEYTRRTKENPNYAFYKNAKNKAAAAGEKGFKHLESWNCKNNPILSNYTKAGKRQDKYSPFRYFVNKARSRINGYPHGQELKKFDITVELLLELWESQKGKCAITGVKMELPKTTYSPRNSPSCASLDRIDTSKGYMKDNVEFICQFVNLGKNNYSKNQIQKFFDQIT